MSRLHWAHGGDIPEARRLLKQGLSLVEVAGRLGVLSRDLNGLLWSYMGIPDHMILNRFRLYTPDF